MKKNTATWILLAALVALGVASLFIGAIDVDFRGLLRADSLQWKIFLASRVPRLLAILCTGIGMSIAGLIMQQLCMNKFISPTTGATISSAQLGILFALLFMPNSTLWGRALFAFAAAVAGTWVFVLFIQRIRFKDVIMVPLVGIMFSDIIRGVTGFLSYKFDMTQSLSSWLVGHFSLVIRGNYEIVYLVVPLVLLACLFANHFNIVGMGREFSRNLVRGRKSDMKQKNLSGMSKILIMLAVTLLVAAAYTVFGLRFSNERLLHYQLEKRIPKLIVIALTAFSIGSASIVFQSVINNTIVTPCLLGMDALYTLVHTLVYFFAGAASVLVTNKQIAFSVDLAIMAVVGMVIYSYTFKKTGSNVLYVILIGTVLTSLFSSLQSTMTRMMDPNAYDTLLTTLVASFDNANTSLIVFSAVVLLFVALFFWKDLRLLDALTLGKDKAVNLGIDYDRSIRRLLFAVTLYMTVATALVGPLAFLGLIIANLSRQVMQTYRHSLLISASVLFGMIVLLGGQFLVERIFSYNIPVSVFITTGGGIYFLYLLLVKRKPY